MHCPLHAQLLQALGIQSGVRPPSAFLADWYAGSVVQGLSGPFNSLAGLHLGIGGAHKKRALKARFCKAGGGRQKLSSTAPLLALEALKANLASTPRV